MCQYLPTGEFKFLPTWQLQEILRTRPDADYGFFLEVDLHCPPHIHDLLNDFPPAPSKTRPSQLSPFQREMIAQNLRASHPNWNEERISEEIAKENTSEKLIASLEDKKNYVCHYRLLQKYVELGMEVSFIYSKYLGKAIGMRKSYRDLSNYQTYFPNYSLMISQMFFHLYTTV